MPSKIEWTTETWNPVTGCTQISPGCERCYAIRDSWRLAHSPNSKISAGYAGVVTKTNGKPNWTGEVRLSRDVLQKPYHWKKDRMIFVNSMSDSFHSKIPDSFRKEILEVIRNTPRHTYQILTKRERGMLRFFTENECPANVWLGVTIESQDYEIRAEHLKQISAPVRFLSCEPLLGPLSLDLNGIDWVIVGGESGPGARPMDAEWARDLRDQCYDSNVPFFFKQWGGRNKKAAGRILDGRIHDAMPGRMNPAA